MSRTGDKMKALKDMKDEYLREISNYERLIEAARNKLAGLEAAMAAISGVATPKAEPVNVSRNKNVKSFIMDIIVQKDSLGVTADEIVEAAKSKGRTLPKSSVSSLLSRLKSQKTLRFDGDRYYPINATPKEQMVFPKLAVSK